MALCHLEKSKAPSASLTICEREETKEEQEGDSVKNDGHVVVCSDIDAVEVDGSKLCYKPIGLLFSIMVICVVVSVVWSLLGSLWDSGKYVEILKTLRSIETQLQAQEEVLNDLQRHQSTCDAK